MIGNQTGKVVGYSVRNKTCRICENAVNKSQQPAPHDGKRNWKGSSKSMEPDMVVEMVESVIQSGVRVEALVADDDTTTIARIHREIDPTIKKLSDKNHIRKNVANPLNSLQKVHSSLSANVIKYFQKSFSYMISQNQENPSGIEKVLSALSLHPFGYHTECSDVWCQHLSNSAKKYNSLPYGRPLESKALQEDIAAIFNKLKKHSSKLASLGSTQANESFNKTVSTKAPKTNLLSRTVGYRVAASVAQKKIGHSYLIHMSNVTHGPLVVHRKLGLSPRAYTKKLAILRDMQNRKKRALAVAREAKKKRLQIRAKRKQITASKETREGCNYSSQIGLQNSEDIVMTEIPPPCNKPTCEEVDISSGDHTLIFFDIETTGLARTSHITQIAAVHRDDKFSTDVMPKVAISPFASEITGLQTNKRPPMGLNGHLSIRDFTLTSCQKGSYLYINSPIIE